MLNTGTAGSNRNNLFSVTHRCKRCCVRFILLIYALICLFQLPLIILPILLVTMDNFTNSLFNLAAANGALGTWGLVIFQSVSVMWSAVVAPDIGSSFENLIFSLCNNARGKYIIALVFSPKKPST